MEIKWLSLEGLEYFFNSVKRLIPTKNSQLENDSDFITVEEIGDMTTSAEIITWDEGDE
ncbi:hypothetical protein M2140_000168 [Clostridiales Family XIII bacterium PM5-7]